MWRGPGRRVRNFQRLRGVIAEQVLRARFVGAALSVFEKRTGKVRGISPSRPSFFDERSVVLDASFAWTACVLGKLRLQVAK